MRKDCGPPSSRFLPNLWDQRYGNMVYHMPKLKATFTLDEQTVARLGRTAKQLSMPKSQVVREAIGEYSARIGRLGEEERLRLLRTFDEVVPAIPERAAPEVEREIREVREARRTGGRWGSDKA